MAHEEQDKASEASEEVNAASVRGWRWRLAKAVAVTLACLAALLAAAALLLDTSPGRRLVADALQAVEFENGMQIGVGRIEGSLYGSMIIHDLTLTDPEGEFLFAPRVELDWRPLAFLGNRLDIRSAAAQRMVLHRLPRFRETPPSDAPFFPDYDIAIGSLEIERLIVEKPVTGKRRIATLSAKANITDGRAKVRLAARTIAIDGGGAGDRLVVDLDAVPDQDRLALTADVDAPADGVLAVVTGLGVPLAIDLKGGGSWKKWNGTLAAASGDTEIALFRLGARDGTFTLKGPAQLAPVASGVIQRLFASKMEFDLTAKLADGALALNADIDGAALGLSADGTVDFSEEQFERLALGLELKEPSALNPSLGGSGLNANLTLDGNLRAPRIRYVLSASNLTYGQVALSQFRANGVARVEDGLVQLPVEARAQRITGIDGAAGGAIADVRLSGDVTINRTRIIAENIRVRSKRMDGNGVMIADLETGHVGATLNGRIDRYRLESVALLTLVADADISAEGVGGLDLSGRVMARSTSLLNDGLKRMLGGNFAAGGDVHYKGGTIRLANLRLSAPHLSVARGQGAITADGRITFDAGATSDRYGQIALRMTGTIANPDARIMAEHPGFGIGLTDLEARITGIDKGLRLAVTAGSDYGPLTADVGLVTRGPLEVRINHAELSGVRFSGGLQQSWLGPFAGTLAADGNGLSGTLTLKPEGKFQAASFKLRSNGSVFRGPANLAVDTAIIDGTAVFLDRPRIEADAQVAGLRVWGFDAAAARIRIDYRDGRGNAKALLESGGTTPFRLAANARLEPDIWTVALKGRVRGIDVVTASPARIRSLDGNYELRPTTLRVGGGTVKLAGSYGESVRMRALLDGLDLAVVNAFVPGLGIGGQASGSLNLAQAGAAAVPRVDARMKISGFTRSTALAVSQPVDASLSGFLAGDRGEVRTVLRTDGGVAGRLHVFLTPTAGRPASWQRRFRTAVLSGGIRYNGPADTLFSLTGQPNQRLTGTLAVAADFSCRLDDPCLTGIVRGKGLTYENRSLGTRISAIDLDGRFAGNRINVERLTASAGSGTLNANGWIGLSASGDFPVDLALSFDRAQLARSDTMSTSATGELRLHRTAGQAATLSGTLRLPETRYRLVREGAAQVSQLSGVRFLPQRSRKRITGDELPMAVASLFDEIALDIDIVASDRLYVSGMGLESEWSARFKLLGTPANPRLDGNFALLRGTIGFAGKSFRLTKGNIRFDGAKDIDPELNLTAVEKVEQIAVTVEVLGRASDPQIAFSSAPSLPEDEILSRILFGRSIANLGPLQAVQLAASLNTLQGSGKGLNPLGKLRSATGIDRLRIVATDEKTGKGTAIAAGQHLTDNVYVELVTDARGYAATQLEVSITPWLSVLSQAGGSGGNNIDVKIKKDY